MNIYILRSKRSKLFSLRSEAKQLYYTRKRNPMRSRYLNECYAGLGISAPELFPNDSRSDVENQEIGPVKCRSTTFKLLESFNAPEY